MQTKLSVIVLCVLAMQANAVEFSRSAHFASVEAFVTAAKAFKPASTKSDLTSLFTVPELGQAEDRKTAKPVTAPAIESSEAMYNDDTQAFVFITAKPPIEATHEIVGVLFLLVHQNGAWQISDLKRFTAIGKYGDVKAEICGHIDAGIDKDIPIVTINESQGGRGGHYQVSATYKAVSSRLQQVELE